MRLYHFTSEKHGLEALKKRRLKIARISELNDPFEFLGWNLREQRVRDFMHKWKDERDTEYGILSFSEKPSNPLLWGHYADKHRGMVIGFEVPDEGDKYHPVRYRPRRLEGPSGRQVNAQDLEDVLLTKFNGWRHESEFRCFCSLADSIQENGLYFEPFSAELDPAEVIVGSRSAISRADLAQALGNTKVKTWKARPAFGAFKVVRNLNQALWA